MFILLGYSARPIGYMPKKSYICKFSFARRVNKYIATKHNKLENYLDISRLPKIVATLSRSVPWLYFITKVGNTKYSDGLDTRNMGFWLWKWCQEMVEQGFSSFFAKFFAYLMIFQSFVVPLVHSTWKIIKVAKMFAKKYL